jgi:hypothetical protein
MEIKEIHMDATEIKTKYKIETLQYADLRHAYLRGANLQGNYLRGADLRHANLQRADLRGADLRHANLQDADLRGANLQDADLQGADLLNTILDPAAPMPAIPDAAICEAGLTIDGDIVRGWRTAKSIHCGTQSYTAQAEPYVAPYFSVDQLTPCHPGIYLASLDWLREEYPDVEIVPCHCLRSELVHAGDKWRCKRLWIDVETVHSNA